VRDEVGSAALRDRLVLMQCVSAYPAPIEEASVCGVPFLAERTGLRVGYSNHVIGPEACYAAAALGACMIEVHFTDCKTGREFRDHSLSFEPDDLRALLAVLPRIRASLGVSGKQRMPSELANLRAVRKGIVAARDLPAGTVLKREDLMFARPQTEFAAGEIDTLVGRKLGVTLATGELVPRSGV
jgi:N-acetylneuraminate synthase/N,N'-diacetyllegionaminate synthase